MYKSFPTFKIFTKAKTHNGTTNKPQQNTIINANIDHIIDGANLKTISHHTNTIITTEQLTPQNRQKHP